MKNSESLGRKIIDFSLGGSGFVSKWNFHIQILSKTKSPKAHFTYESAFRKHVCPLNLILHFEKFWSKSWHLAVGLSHAVGRKLALAILSLSYV